MDWARQSQTLQEPLWQHVSGHARSVRQAGEGERPTQWGMLEGESHDVLDSFERQRNRVSQERLADDNFDTTNIVCRAPEALVKQFLSEFGELQGLEVTALGEIYILSAEGSMTGRSRKPTKAVGDDMRPASVTLKGRGAIA